MRQPRSALAGRASVHFAVRTCGPTPRMCHFRFPPFAARLVAMGATLAAASFGALGCASVGEFVWVDDVTTAQLGSDYLIGPGDLVSIRVFNQEPLSTRAKVRSDGKLAVPFLGDVMAAGKRPGDFRREIELGMKPFLVQPSVLVTVEEARPLTVSVMGEVGKPGLVTLEGGAGIAQALASAGGPNEFADRDRIFVVRRAPTPARIRFTYEAITRGVGRAPNFALNPGDLVVVE